MNTYCWVQGTFTLPSDIVSQVKMKVAHPGVSPHLNYQLTLDQEDPFFIPVTEEGEEIRHAWYQWVCFVLFLQAIMCYFPHYLWKYFEGEDPSLAFHILVLFWGDLMKYINYPSINLPLC